MIVGKTSTSITKAEIFNKFREIEVLSSIFPEIKNLPYKMSSPFREDKNPSFCLFSPDGNRIFYKDFGTGEAGNLINFLCKYWNCTFRDTINRLADLLISKNNVNISKAALKILTSKEIVTKTKLQVVTRPWRDYDLEYWKSYGVEKKWLKYAEIYPISYEIIVKQTDTKESKYIFPTDKYAYCFVERKEGNLQLKIYQPYSQHKWCSKMDGSVVGLWTKIPEEGDKVVICSSLKDALCLSCQMHIPALCLQGEGYGMSDTAIKELKRRYKKVYILFDNDKAGLADGENLANKTGFTNLVLPQFEGGKDLSDLYKLHGRNVFINTVSSLFEHIN